ncbi:hypothetical protein SAMN04489761_3338 [Tenacibaculum sp. MAR_2009_124]|uniref:hypothetical protein n=1 Tax=Tenacibaculum sp. MAR_2009_124 TaxID=1250059 RepID=UPI00089A3BA8|nr:hypothetical protein [Tenacibaculum sp. MAR_2009_124]SEC56423.1 hypothetical protein SAMN04489761_3338 [Tenacibaculum sp. MAR_2009_124]
MYKVKASSLAESVLSLALVSIAIVISMMMFSNLFGSFHSRVIEIETIARMDSIKIEIEQSPKVFLGRRKFNFNNVIITTDLVEKSEDLALLNVLAEKNGKGILDKKYLIIYEKK